MTTAIARNDFDYLDRPFAAQSFTPAQTQKAADDTAAPKEVAKAGADTENDTSLFGEDGFGFNDFLDIINPLQHIPVISTLYREITGDELSPGARMIGGGIFGGGIGLASSVINSAIEMETGKDIGGHVMALFSDEEEDATTLAAAPENGTPVSAAPSPAPAEAATVIPEVTKQAPTPVSPAAAKSEEMVATPDALVSAQSQAMSAKAQPAAGLEWKDAPPKLQQGLQRLQQVQGQNLSEAQLSQILGAFNGAKIVTTPTSADKGAAEKSAPVKAAPEVKTAAPAAARAYETGRNVSDFAYMDRAI